MPSEQLSKASRTIQGLLAKTSGVHAVLFYGAEGSPVEDRGRELAAGWLCQNLNEAGACGACRSCTALGRGTHADIFVVKPLGRSRIIRVGQITERPKVGDEEPFYPLQTFFRTPALFGSCKVGIIEDADRMSSSAVSALLKTLEEPYDYVKLVLTTHAFSGILPTVISRCVAIPCELSAEDQVPAPELAECEAIIKQLGTSNKGAALRIADEFREFCGKLEEADDNGGRAANTKAIAELARLLLNRFPNRPDWAQAAIEAHRRIVGNAQAGLVFDALFTKLAADNTRTA